MDPMDPMDFLMNGYHIYTRNTARIRNTMSLHRHCFDLYSPVQNGGKITGGIFDGSFGKK